jgi:hypothetical protein
MLGSPPRHSQTDALNSLTTKSYSRLGAYVRRRIGCHCASEVVKRLTKSYLEHSARRAGSPVVRTWLRAQNFQTKGSGGGGERCVMCGHDETLPGSLLPKKGGREMNRVQSE